MDQKKCSKCGELKGADSFPGRGDSSGKLKSNCKDCCYETYRKWASSDRGRLLKRAGGARYYRTKNGKEKIYEGNARYAKTKKGREVLARSVRKYKEKNPQKVSAHWALNSAVKRGKISKKPCERCGRSERIHAHHDDYSKPLDVMWLCAMHHKERHRELKNG